LLFRAAVLASLLAIVSAPAWASVAPVVTRSWAGYVAGGRGQLHFRTVSAAWTQPSLKCTSGNPGFSGIWVGLGGFKPTSKSVEQIGTRLDCGSSGRVTSGAWYELTPARAQFLKMTVTPGDHLWASVRVMGHEAQLTLVDATRHEIFQKRLAVAAPDVSSADWIVEAPTGCAGQGNCAELPLADFGSVRIIDAHAVLRSGQTGSIVSRTWTTTKVEMLPDPIPYDPHGSGYSAIPGALKDGDRAFTVPWLSSGYRYYVARVARAALDTPGRRLQPGGVRAPR
jgi:hypothetical protein